MAVQVTQRQRVSRWVGKRDLRLDPEVAIDMDQFARVQRAPSPVLVHRLAREHDDGLSCRLLGSHSCAEAAAVLEGLVSLLAAGAALEDVQSVGLRVAQGEELGVERRSGSTSRRAVFRYPA